MMAQMVFRKTIYLDIGLIHGSLVRYSPTVLALQLSIDIIDFEFMLLFYTYIYIYIYIYCYI